MSLIRSEPVKIKLFYTEEEQDGNVSINVLSEEEAKDKLGNEEEKDSVKTVMTFWKKIGWKDYNDLMQKCSKTDQYGSLEFDSLRFTQMVIERCFDSWDYMENGKNIPLTPEIKDNLDPVVINRLFGEYSKFLSFKDEPGSKN